MPTAPEDDRIAKHNARVLACAQALGGANPAIVVSLGGLVGQALAEDKSLATLPVSVFNLGLAAGTIPAALMMQRFGRRNGYVLGASIGILAGCASAFAIVDASFWLFCLATFVGGFYSAYVQSYRFAATDAASPGFKARAISWVMVGGLAGAFIGPQVANLARDLVPNSLFAGSFLGQATLALISIAVVAFLRPVPVVAASRDGGRPLGEIVRQPRFAVAVVAGLASYGLMSFVMTAAPLAMVDCGHSIGLATLGISWHILAMYGPSFVTGRLIERFGKERVTVVGLVLIAAAAAVGLNGLSVAHFWSALVLLGVGWNLSFIGATALVTDCYRPEERAKVQATNDFLVFGSVALASFSSGRLLSVGGWSTVNQIVFLPVLIAIALLIWRARQGAPAPA
jgi:MFS family permease